MLVVGLALWVCVWPSDHPEKTYVVLSVCCGDGVEIVLAEPSITVDVMGPGPLLAPDETVSPGGSVVTVCCTVRGSSVRDTVTELLLASVAVSLSSSDDG